MKTNKLFVVGDKVKWGKRKGVYKIMGCSQINTNNYYVSNGGDESMVHFSKLTKVPKRAVKKGAPLCNKTGSHPISECGSDGGKDVFFHVYNEIDVPQLPKVDMTFPLFETEKQKEEKVNWYLIIALALGCLLVLAWGTGIERAVGII